MSDELPDKIERLDVLIVEQSHMRPCRCREPKYDLDLENRLVYCRECGAIVDPFTALKRLAFHHDRLSDHIQYLLDERKKILNYKPHLKVMKDLESNYRRNKFSMVPCCPVCDQPFDLPEITRWVGRAFVDKPRKE